MQELMIILSGLLFFVAVIIIFLVNALSKDTMEYDMTYLWSGYDVKVDDMQIQKTKK
jgi:hypothetical protein